METWGVVVITSTLTCLASVAASAGFWNFLQKRTDKKSAVTKLVLGLAHDRIIFLGMSYIDRGWITKDEYEDFFKYLYAPYSEFGGNGLAEKVMEEVTRLPISGNKLGTHNRMKESYERQRNRGAYQGGASS